MDFLWCILNCRIRYVDRKGKEMKCHRVIRYVANPMLYHTRSKNDPSRLVSSPNMCEKTGYLALRKALRFAT